MTPDDVLSGRAGVAGVRSMVCGVPSRRRLRTALAALLADGATLGPARLERTKLKPGRKLAAHYRIGVRDRDGVRHERAVAVTWAARADAVHASAAAAQAEIDERGLTAPFAACDAQSPEPPVRIRVWPLDDGFAQLARMSDAAHVAALLGGAGAHCTVRAVRYRPGERHVLRYDCERRRRRPAIVYAKLYRDDRGRRAFAAASEAAGALRAASGGELAAVPPLEYVTDEAALLVPHVDGVPLAAHLFRRPAAGVDAVRQAGRLLRALHDADIGAAGAPAHDVGDEAAETLRAAQHIEALLPAAGVQARRVVDRALAAYAGVPRGPARFVHRDFKADHLLVGPGRLTLIDFDSCFRGDPAIDVAKFLADLDWWHVRRRSPAAVVHQHAFLAGYHGRGRPAAPAARILHALFLVKLAARRPPLASTDWEWCVRALVARAEAVLHGAEAAPPRGAEAGTVA
jgi:aminoglycoside phosphotransferase (APT) family kinase protein